MRRIQCQQWNADSCFTFAKNRILTNKAKNKMTSIKARLNRSRLGSDGMYPLVIQVIRHRTKREVCTPYRLKASGFDMRSEKAVAECNNKKHRLKIREINEYIISIKDELEKVVSSLSGRDADYTSDDIIACFKVRNDMSRFFTYADYKTAELENDGKNGTAANYRSAVNAFERYVGNRELSMDDITRKTIDGFIGYQLKRGNNPNTVLFYLKQLRAIYNKAVDDGIVHSSLNPFQKIKLKSSKTPKRAVSKREIDRIIALNLAGKHRHLTLARDLFMFSLYTRGMAFVDMCYLKRDNIRDNAIVYKRRKTGQWLQIKIEPPLKALLNKYADTDSPYLLPMLRKDDSYKGYRYIQRRLNKRMRQIGDMLGFDFPLTFYVARHTWATLAHDKGIPLPVISESMGHTSEKTTRIYLAELNHRILDKANRVVMSLWSRAESVLS